MGFLTDFFEGFITGIKTPIFESNCDEDDNVNNDEYDNCSNTSKSQNKK